MKQRGCFQRLYTGVKNLQFTSNIRTSLRGNLGDVGHYPIVFDPTVEQMTLIVGMFVLRPAYKAWISPLILERFRQPEICDNQLHRIEDWAYNYRGIDGGNFISDGNPFDTFRVALQYGISDAVIVGTNTISKEGICTPDREGYIWQPYFMTNLENLKTSCPDALNLINDQRKELQQQGILSARTHPAQIIFSHSGKMQGDSDFLSARIFNAIHPNGDLFECYILTSEQGAENIRSRVSKSYPLLQDRIDDMLITIPYHSINKTAMDIALVPNILYNLLDIRIANHDGGKGILRDFCKAGALAQVNLTLCRDTSMREIVSKCKSALQAVNAKEEDITLESFSSDVELFFTSHDARLRNQLRGVRSGTIPMSWKEIYCVTDDKESMAVVTFDTREGGDFSAE